MDKFFLNLKNVLIFMKDAECAETNEVSIFQFLVFEIWSFLNSKLVNFSMIFEYKIDHNSKSQKSENWFLIRFSSLCIYHAYSTSAEDFFWEYSVLYIKNLNIVNKIDYNSKNKNRKSDFSFDSALWASIIKNGSKTGGGGGLHILSYIPLQKKKCLNILCQFTHDSNVIEGPECWNGLRRQGYPTAVLCGMELTS